LTNISIDSYDENYKQAGDYINNVYNPFVTRMNKATTGLQAAKDLLPKLRGAWAQYTKAEEIDKKFYRLEWDEETEIPEVMEYVDWGISTDIEKDAKGNIILHLGMEMIAENLLHQWYRVSYRMNCKAGEILSSDIMEPLIGNCMDNMKIEIATVNKERSRQLNMKNIEVVYELVNMLTAGFVEGMIENGGLQWENDDMFDTGIHIDSPAGFQLLGVTLVNVMEQVLYSNKVFDNATNRTKFNDFCGLSQYTTLKYLLPKMDKGPLTLNNREYFLFLALIDCACQLLLGDRGDYLFEGLEKVGVDASLRAMFLSNAQKHYNNSLDYFRKKDITISFLEKPRDWNMVIR
jgi:hypothetical protein